MGRRVRMMGLVAATAAIVLGTTGCVEVLDIPPIYAINDKGVMVAGNTIRQPDGTTVPGDGHALRALNADGTAVGYRLVRAGGIYTARRPYGRLANGDEAPLLLYGFGSGEAYDVNDHGIVVGYLGWPAEATAVVWGTDGYPSPLPAGDETTAMAKAVNDRGDVVGTIGDGERRRAVRWDAGARTLTVLDDRESDAVDINTDGTIVGTVTVDGVVRAAVWSTSGVRILPGEGPSHATALNDQGEVVGYVDRPPADPDNPPFYGSSEAAYWSPTGERTLLGTTSEGASAAMAINNHGVIAGWAVARLDDGSVDRRGAIFTR